MKNALSIAMGMAACTLVASTLVAARLDQSAAQQTAGSAAAADDAAAGLFSQMCSPCHDGARITAMRRTKTDWEDVLKKMIENGATGSEKDFETVYEYLLRNFGKIYINSATPADIALILGLSTKDAEAIVAYRRANGPFADFDAVKKVPDIDIKKLDARKDAVAF